MKIIADTHTHTIASTHAYSTILENLEYAKRTGLKAFVVSDHGPAMPDSPHIWHLLNLKAVPRYLDGIYILKGVEANIINYDGDIDIDPEIAEILDWVNVGFHEPACPSKSIEDHTNAYIKLAQNPFVDAIVHSGTNAYKYDYEKVIKTFKEYGKIVEINESSAKIRSGSLKNCVEIAKICKKYEANITVSSDSHFATNVGRFYNSMQMLKEIDFPEHLIINADKQRFFGYIKDKKGIDILS